jgi:hypothetical protein
MTRSLEDIVRTWNDPSVAGGDCFSRHVGIDAVLQAMLVKYRESMRGPRGWPARVTQELEAAKSELVTYAGALHIDVTAPEHGFSAVRRL